MMDNVLTQADKTWMLQWNYLELDCPTFVLEPEQLLDYLWYIKQQLIAEKLKLT